MTYRFQRVSKITLLCFAGLWALLFATYSGALTGEFLFDDEFLVIKNTFIHQWPSWKTIFTSSTTMGSGGIDSFYRPLQTLTYYFIYQVAGASVLEFHFLNIFIHGLNACLIYVLGIHLRFSRLASYIGALIWMLHPLHTECVAYISATADSLYVFFSLVGLISLFPTFSVRRIAMASVFFVLGLLTKESAIVFPALAFVSLYVSPERPSRFARAALRTLPLWIIAFTYLILRKTVLDFDNSFQFYATPNIYTENILFRFYTFLATIPAYLQLLVYPTEQHFDRHFMVFTDPLAAQVLTGAAFLVAATFYVLFPWRNKNRALVFGFLWLACAHFPHTGIFVPVNALILEHWMYFPSAGLLLGVASALGLWLQKLHFALNLPRLFVPVLSVVAVALVLGAEIYLTFQQNKVWANPIALYSNNIRYNPSGSARIYNNLAMAYDEAGRVSEAIMTYKQAIAIQDTYPQTHHNLGRSYLRQDNTDDAIKEFEAAIAIDPNFYHSYAMLAQVYEKLGDVQKSQDYYKKFLEIRKKFFP